MEDQITNWRDKMIQDKSTKMQTLKIQDKEEVTGWFLDEGKFLSSIDYGESVVFTFLKDGETEPRAFYVNWKNKPTLQQIEDLGELEGLKVKISRHGTKKSDTRYFVQKI